MRFRRNGLLLLALGALLLPDESTAKLGKSSLDSLIDESQLIVEAATLSAERTGPLAGFAVLKIIRVVVGAYPEDRIKISWGDEVHDQRIATLEHDRLLFLRRQKDGTYSGTHYGRSYWPFRARIIDLSRVDLDSARRGFVYEYPMTMVEFSPAQKREMVTARKSFGEQQKFVEYRALRNYILLRKRGAGPE